MEPKRKLGEENEEQNKQILNIIHAADHVSLEELQELIYKYGSCLRADDIRERQLFVYMAELLRRLQCSREHQM